MCLLSVAGTKQQQPRKCSLPREDNFLTQLEEDTGRQPGTGFQVAIHTQFLSFIGTCVRSPRTCFVPWLSNSNTRSHGWNQSHRLQQDSTFPIIWVYELLNHWKAHITWVGQENEDLDVRGQSRVREPNPALCQPGGPWQVTYTLHALDSSNANWG